MVQGSAQGKNIWWRVRAVRRWILGGCWTLDRRLQSHPGGSFFTVFLPHSPAMGLQIRQKLLALG